MKYPTIENCCKKLTIKRQSSEILLSFKIELIQGIASITRILEKYCHYWTFNYYSKY